MLLNVNVKNLALIKHADINFENGLNILTGETGAGKSIIIGSILIALGEKVHKEIIREGTKEGFVELIFLVEDKDTVDKLNALGVIPEEGKIIISRKISNGRSIIRINGETYTTSNLKKVTELLIDIHGQHDHQSLLKTQRHLEILDKFAENDIKNIKDTLSFEYNKYTQLKKQLLEYSIDEETRNREISFCKYEIDEIESANLTKGEYEENEILFRKLSGARKVIDTLSEVNALIGYERSEGAGERISTALRMMQSLDNNDKSISDMSSSMSDLESICQDLSRSIQDYVEDLSFDEMRINEVEERVNLLNKLRQKYANSVTTNDVISEIIDYKDKQIEKLDKLENLEIKKNALIKELDVLTKKIEELCIELSDKRKSNATKFEKNIIEVLRGLNFLDVKFNIKFDRKDEFNSNGFDNVEFMISTNPGEPLMPLAKVASGGELSRIMLGIKTIMASKDSIDTLIFDEIDTGISGKTAQLVAERMKSVSRVHQIICITHLPQIAAMADSHYLIEKNVENDVTSTRIKELNEKESIMELSRMLSGSEVTKTVIENATEMKNAAKELN